MYKTSFLLIALILTFNLCQQKSQDTGENSAEVLSKNHAYVARFDSLEDLADKMRDAEGSIQASLVVKFDGGWLAGKSLNTMRRVTLENKSNKKVIGVKLAYGTGMSKEFDDRNVGKFKIVIKPHGKATLQIPAKRFGVSDDVIQNPSYTSLMFRDSIAASDRCLSLPDSGTR